MIPFSVASVSEKREAYSAEKGSDRTRSGGFCVYGIIWRDPADRVHIDTWKDGIAKWFASTGWQTHKHIIPFQKKTSHSSQLIRFDLAVSQFGGCQRDKRFVQIGHVTCKSRDKSVHYAITAIWLALLGFWQGTRFPMKSHQTFPPRFLSSRAPPPIIVPWKVWPARL